MATWNQPSPYTEYNDLFKKALQLSKSHEQSKTDKRRTKRTQGTAS